jgi:hypothetical protein
MRYLVAMIVCVVIIGPFLVNHWYVTKSIAAIHQQARLQFGTPPGAPTPDFGVELPSRLRFAVRVDHAWMRLWPVLILASLAGSLGTAAVFGRSKFHR